MKCLLAFVLACSLSLGSVYSLRAQSNTTYWWNDAVFYEAFVRSYYDSDGNGIGDFKGLTAKLDYISGLGVSAIWLMPVCASPSYHGYDVSNYRQVNPQYGTTQDFNDFVTAAHNKGIKIIFDFVMNHSSNQNSWFQQSAANNASFRNFYRWSSTNPGYNGPWGQTVWHKYSTGNYYYGIFDSSMPDLNYTDATVKDSMFNIADFWLNTMHIDGFRCDAAPYIIESGQYQQNTPETIQFWKDFHDHYTSVNPNAMAVGEVWMSTDTIIRYVGGKFDFCFEFNLASDILNAVNNTNTQSLISNFQYMYDHYPFAQFGTFLSNHDQDRSYGVLSSINRAKVAAGIYLTLPGIPFVYYGEEIGMTGSGQDQNKRTPMQWSNTSNAGFTTGSPWESINSNYTTANVATETADSTSLLNWYKKLISARNTNAALRRGTYYNAISDKSEVFSYVRSYQGQNLLVVINTGNQLYSNASLNLYGSGITNGAKTFSDLLSNNSFNATISAQTLSGISIGAYGVNVYELTDFTGVNDVEGNGEVAVYPNPVENELNINLKNAPAGNYVVTVTDMEGRDVKILALTADDLSHPQDVSALPAGMYIVHVSNGSLNHYFKIVKM